MFEKLIPYLQNSQKIGIFAHTNPDGDAMGSSYSLKLALLSLGKQAEVFLNPNAEYMALALIKGKDPTGLAKEDCDLLVALDCGDADRLGDDRPFFMDHHNTISIDHHITHKLFAKETVIQDVSSTCEMMVTLYHELGVSLTPEIANNLYIGLVSDTGNFKYSCVTPATLRCAAEVMEAGINAADISKKLFDTKTPEYYTLMRIALDRLKLYEDGKVGVLYLSQEDFAEARMDESQSVGIVTIPTSIAGVEVGVYIRVRDDGEFKVSLRSVDYVDASKIAKDMGGGGHVRASGYNVTDSTVEEIVEQALVEIRKQL